MGGGTEILLQDTSSLEAYDRVIASLELSEALVAVVANNSAIERASAGLRAVLDSDQANAEWSALLAGGLATIRSGAGALRLEGNLTSRRLGVRAVRLEVSPIDGDSGSVLVIGHDITDDRAREAKLDQLALNDGLTGLPNRRLLSDRVGQALLVSERQHEPLAVIVLDLDRFKEVNDTYGHRTGDLLLAQIGSRIRSVLRDSDTVARLGGDEFAILLPPPADSMSAYATARKVREALTPAFEISGAWLETQASLGIALAPLHSRTVDGLLDKADVAMYVAKRARTNVAIYDAEHDLNSTALLSRVAALRAAIDSGGLDLSFQPSLRLQSGAVVRAEALVRWPHATLGQLRAAAFVPLAERNGLGQSLTRWVLGRALGRCQEWRMGGVDAGVSVNVFVRDLLDPEFPTLVARELSMRSIAPSALMLDVSERALPANADALLQPLRALARSGVRIALDDFGSGAASVGLLQRLPLSEIKLDQHLVATVLTDPKSWSLVRTGIDVARDLGLESSAEGVEDLDTRDILARFGCDLAQGRFFDSSAARASFAFLESRELENAMPVS
jgi:diguanylate cyclase (GGDEF)-like protein